ncbi:hypothetical protein [Speluncibacter jeojiensis]|uniref:GPI inositol-deacylase n=1 Tax=Speluncibacter jeojiensis TaxID=2710754 RepID=A0A9X4RFQ9_9ACTN|nr:GPI inositol-deacylase [Corynebacteriales bacterium D3-21]
MPVHQWPDDDPSRNEVRSAASMFEQAVDLISHPVQDAHRALADRVFGALGSLRRLGPVAAPARAAHDSLAELTYAGVRAGATALTGMISTAAEVLPEDAVSYADAESSIIVGTIHGVVDGDPSESEDEAEAETESAAEAEGAPVLGTHQHLRRFGSSTVLLTDGAPVTDHAVVLVHALGATEQAWWYRTGGSGTVVAGLAELGCTPVILRLDPARLVADNGRELSRMLAALVAGWPGPGTVPPRRIDLVGHSIGGLVVRHACAATESDLWLPLVRTACYLGTPHLGAPVNRGSRQLAEALKMAPEGRTMGEFAGLRHTVDDALRHGTDLPLTEGVRHVGVVATLAEDPECWWADRLGDGLVSMRSARGPLAETVVLPDTGHLRLLEHRRVAELLRELTSDE